MVIFWVLLPGFLFAHVAALVFYYPEVLAGGPLPALRVGTALSSYGGFVGGAFGAIAYLRRGQLHVWDYLDALVLGLCAGWFFGRLGCTIVHDHPGVRSDFFLAVRFPSGSRHDLGFYEWLFTIFLIITLLIVRSLKPLPGVMLGTVCILYAPVRFLLDFLRVSDRLYIGLTPAQYGSAALFLVGIWMLAARLHVVFYCTTLRKTEKQ
jgi:phosphatidylglycerol:prolipoprotein diacylglycerol transferase